MAGLYLDSIADVDPFLQFLITLAVVQSKLLQESLVWCTRSTWADVEAGVPTDSNMLHTPLLTSFWAPCFSGTVSKTRQH